MTINSREIRKKLKILLCCLQILRVTESCELKIVNNCNFTTWPAVLSNSGTVPPSSTGFSLQAGESKVVKVARTWSGRILGRTLCSQDSNGVFSCLTGDCGSSTDQCPGGIVAPPATSAVFIMNSSGGGMDLYDVSPMEGFNIPMTVEPVGGNCTVTGCVMDLSTQCPSHLKVISHGKAVGCKNPCQAFGDAHSSCTHFFKTSCPQARLSVYDQNPRFSCPSTNYLINFCPSYSISYTEPRNSQNTTNKVISGVVAAILVSIIASVVYKIFWGRGRGVGMEVGLAAQL